MPPKMQGSFYDFSGARSTSSTTCPVTAVLDSGSKAFRKFSNGGGSFPQAANPVKTLAQLFGLIR
jgi:hypothetical protein